jgi:acyl dehydratase
MALDPSLVGTSYEPVEPYEVSREKIRELAAAIGDENPAYSDPDTARAFGLTDVVAPPTFLAVITIRACLKVVEGLGLDFSHVVHGDQRFLHHIPVCPGQVLHCVVTIDAIRALGDSDILTLRTEVTEHGVGTSISTVTATLVVRSVELGAAEESDDLADEAEAVA